PLTRTPRVYSTSRSAATPISSFTDSASLPPDSSGRPAPLCLRAAAAAVAAAVAERLDEQPRELRPLAGFLVFEIHEHVAAGGCAVLDHTRPALQVLGCVAFIAQAEICVAGGDLNWRREPLAVGDA